MKYTSTSISIDKESDMQCSVINKMDAKRIAYDASRDCLYYTSTGGHESVSDVVPSFSIKRAQKPLYVKAIISEEPNPNEMSIKTVAIKYEKVDRVTYDREQNRLYFYRTDVLWYEYQADLFGFEVGEM